MSRNRDGSAARPRVGDPGAPRPRWWQTRWWSVGSGVLAAFAFMLSVGPVVGPAYRGEPIPAGGPQPGWEGVARPDPAAFGPDTLFPQRDGERLPSDLEGRTLALDRTAASLEALLSTWVGVTVRYTSDGMTPDEYAAATGRFADAVRSHGDALDRSSPPDGLGGAQEFQRRSVDLLLDAAARTGGLPPDDTGGFDEASGPARQAAELLEDSRDNLEAGDLHLRPQLTG